ncbi:uncharacterized protein LOC131065652 isoform X3 [Cryptomeria japonica]|uniref:uncharacterized protein LOC131065652 isoform X3 n=1 Tax=Cryptomeria japonica TaxID=3369 RepID=UPI0025AB67CF|nr:uncharacterized protein LOC131065652 isoform X3 [Cryptomeria japonica]
MSSSLESRSQGSKCDGTPLSSIEDIQRRLIPPNPTQNTNYSVSLRICAPSPRLARIKRGINNIDAEEVNTTVLLEDYLDSSLLSIAVSKYAASSEWQRCSEWQSCSSENNDIGLECSENYDVKSTDFHTFDRITKLFKM